MLELFILANLMLGPCYGYEIKKTLKGMSVNNNTLYPWLRSLESHGYVTMEQQIQDGKPPRKVYSITESGKQHLFELINDFDVIKASSNDEFYIRVAFFQFLPVESVAAILDAREAALGSYSNKGRVSAFLDNFPDKSYDLLYLHNFANSQINGEKKFVKSLREKYGISK